jgi:uncharacterized protein (DUF1778 family)
MQKSVLKPSKDRISARTKNEKKANIPHKASASGENIS